MIKNISSIGELIERSEQKKIKGGVLPPVTDLCVPIPRELTVCLVPINPKCCVVWG